MANKNTVRKLPLKAIKQDIEKYKETVDIDFIEDGVTYRITLFPFFEPSRINKVVFEFGKDIKAIHETEGLDFSDELIPAFVLFHTILEFSDFPLPKTDDIKKKVSYFSQVINSKYFKECTSYLIQAETDKVWDKIMEVMKANEKLERMAKKMKKELQEMDLQSPEMRRLVQGKE
ncbi:hypothetical protein [Oceanobacillus sp. FSL H7-0719]|uniref:hypothetical protein n=1 Tax=Oceanobacillus sp. FSL H7-0719 TaxID=2954507 RepID=UPI00324A6C19